MRQVVRYLRDFKHLLLPELCVHCSSLLKTDEQHFCNICRDELPLSCFSSLTMNPIHDIFFGRLQVAQAHSYVLFNKKGITQSLIHQFKYKENAPLAYTLGMYHGHFLQDHFNWHATPEAVLVPVPMHDKKLKKRGYNQAEWYAQGLARICHFPVDIESLVKITNTQSQTKKGRFMRWKNVKEIFYLKDTTRFKDKNVYLVDDVLTTGATLEACAREIARSNPASINIITLALAKG